MGGAGGRLLIKLNKLMKKKYTIPQIGAIQIAPLRLMEGSISTKIDDTPASEPSFSRSFFGSSFDDDDKED